MENYLSETSIEFPVEEGNIEQREVDYGVPQRLVLGPILRNIS